ncbi:MAG: CBS domain-containing protein [Candidatus Nomurabacteria bacterium]|nr:CBS domain-containing protein [Candidatus Nomurabacteria bacterium]
MIIQLIAAWILLVVFASFHYLPSRSRFELERLAKTGEKYRRELKWSGIYPGAKVFARLLAVVAAIWLVLAAGEKFGAVGGILAFVLIIFALVVARALRPLSQSLIKKHLACCNKYLGWTKFFGRLANLGGDPQITSEAELLHIIQSGDFLDEKRKNFLGKALNFPDLTAAKIMTPRQNIVFVDGRDLVAPKLLDELNQSGHRIFPVVRGGLDKPIGWFRLSDALPLGQTERRIADLTFTGAAPLKADSTLDEVLRYLAKHQQTSALLTGTDGKTVGLISLSDLARALLGEN